MSSTNSNLTGDGKAEDALKRQKERPEEAVHHPLKDEDGTPKKE